VQGWPDYYQDFTLFYSHASSSINIKWVSGLNQDPADESFGFSTLQIRPYACDGTCATCSSPSATDCIICTSGYVIKINNKIDVSKWILLAQI